MEVHEQDRSVRRWHEIFAVFVAAWLCVCILVNVADAQVPPVPEPPELPSEVTEAIAQAEDTLLPLVIQAEGAAYPALNAIGFTLRPACAASWITVLLVPTAAAYLPVSPAFVVGTTYAVCGPASSRGPADDVFDQADAAAGKDAYAAAKPLIADVSEALQPVSPDAATCALLRLGTPPSYAFPKTLGRVNAVKIVCGK